MMKIYTCVYSGLLVPPLCQYISFLDECRRGTPAPTRDGDSEETLSTFALLASDKATWSFGVERALKRDWNWRKEWYNLFHCEVSQLVVYCLFIAPLVMSNGCKNSRSIPKQLKRLFNGSHCERLCRLLFIEGKMADPCWQRIWWFVIVLLHALINHRNVTHWPVIYWCVLFRATILLLISSQCIW